MYKEKWMGRMGKGPKGVGIPGDPCRRPRWTQGAQDYDHEVTDDVRVTTVSRRWKRMVWGRQG